MKIIPWKRADVRVRYTNIILKGPAHTKFQSVVHLYNYPAVVDAENHWDIGNYAGTV